MQMIRFAAVLNGQLFSQRYVKLLFIESVGTFLAYEYVSLLIGLYKNNGSVSHVAIRFLFM